MKKKSAPAPTLTFLMSPDGDWEAVYVGDKLITQNHHIDTEDILDALKIEYQGYEVRCPSGRYPESLHKALEEMR